MNLCQFMWRSTLAGIIGIAGYTALRGLIFHSDLPFETLAVGLIVNSTVGGAIFGAVFLYLHGDWDERTTTPVAGPVSIGSSLCSSFLFVTGAVVVSLWARTFSGFSIASTLCLVAAWLLLGVSGYLCSKIGA